MKYSLSILVAALVLSGLSAYAESRFYTPENRNNQAKIYTNYQKSSVISTPKNATRTITTKASNTRMPQITPQEAEELLTQAENYLIEGNEEATMQICRYLIDSNQKVADAISLAYHCLKKNNATHEEIIAFLAPDSTNLPPEQVYIQLATDLLLYSNHRNHADQMVQTAIDLNYTDIETYLKMANVYNRIGDKEKAAELLQAASQQIRSENDQKKFNKVQALIQM